ncbi:hypothetical protein [Zobellia galactanivorans]|uniref:Conserved hypothetical membrane protein n=1 Tax=Zobellia galactanivorans (strain DSM 12802 / CCUG 47099 / CIP 106680 / NCIMB 13871 / Dsij) TaxID=63186 RepID=G0L9X9_ZOBGA|nr:hypothetical protein [Zobellia galactanivorans]CAZ94912.1 Conserved hypothetical membrane protein [Zobellia galactanivorans]
MEQTITFFIYLHAFLGGIGLISGIGSTIAKKGSPLHQKLGKLFSIGMIGSSTISIPIAMMPNHENLFLLLIGLFTIYLVLVGNRALQFKTRSNADIVDKAISGSMLLFSVIMLGIGMYSLMNTVTTGVLYIFFGGFGLLLTLKDFQFYKNPQKTKNGWLLSHIGKMIGALIASITAFIIAGLSIGNLMAWTLPTVLGTIYIMYWKRKVNPKTVASKKI